MYCAQNLKLLHNLQSLYSPLSYHSLHSLLCYSHSLQSPHPIHFLHFLLPLGHCVDYVEPLKTAFREKRFVVREFTYDAAKAGGLDGQIQAASVEVQEVHTNIVHWCKAHFGEVYSGWIHLKVIRGFIESVLRYGLPLDFLPVFIEPNMKREKQLKVALADTISRLRPELAKKAAIDAEEDEDDTDNLPFVCQKFSVIGSGASSEGK